jgi:integrase
MGELRELILRDYRINGRASLQRADAAFRHLCRYFRAMPSTEFAVRYAVARRAEGYAPATIRYELAILRRAVNLAFQSGLIEHRPYIPSVRVQNARVGFFEDAQLEALIAALPDPVNGMARFAAITGWRVAEVVALTWDRVDLGAGVLRLEPGSTKSGDGRTFPFLAHPLLADLIARRWRRRCGPFVFHRRGRPVGYFRRSWIRACSRAGASGKVFHDLRRTAVRNMERAGVPRSVAMKLTGHKTESIYLRYAITNEEDLAEGVRRIAARGSGSVGRAQ